MSKSTGYFINSSANSFRPECVWFRAFLAFRRLSPMTQCTRQRIWCDQPSSFVNRNRHSPWHIISHLPVETRSQSVDSKILLFTNAPARVASSTFSRWGFMNARDWCCNQNCFKNLIAGAFRIRVSGFSITACRLRRVSLSLTEWQQETQNQQRMKCEISEI